jgi:chromosome segregation ATPase
VRRPLLLAAILVLVVGALAAGVEVVGRIIEDTPEARAQARAEEIRDEVRELRPRLRQCLDELDRLEGAFRAQERATEDLRTWVDAFEELDDRGVPRDRYDEYLDVFDRYNESLPEWERRAAELEEVSAACRALAEAHNLRADSLRGLLLDAGILDEDRLPLDAVVPDG